MDDSHKQDCIAFEGSTCVATGPLAEVALAVKAAVEKGVSREILVFDAVTSRPIEIDTRGTPDEVLARLAPGSEGPAPARSPGRPKLGVVAREVTLLPRHWDWLRAQPGGASVTLRKLVDQARRTNGGKDRMRQAQDSAYRFMSAVGGDLPQFEEATRALFAGDPVVFAALIADWPADIRRHVEKLATAVFAAVPPPDTG